MPRAGPPPPVARPAVERAPAVIAREGGGAGIRLAVTGDGLVYRGWVRSQTLRRADIESIRITQFRRWGRTVRLLEIDTLGGQLFVLSRWDLGSDPLDVLDALTDAGYAAPRTGP